jgi:uncharacterized protein
MVDDTDGYQPVHLPPPVPPPPPPAPRPWGPWASLGLGLVVVLVLIVAQTAAAVGYCLAVGVRDFGETAAGLTRNGLFLGLATVLSAPAVIALTVLFASQRRGLTARRYLALQRVSWRTMGLWLAVGLGAQVVAQLASRLVGESSAEEFMRDVYRSAGFLPLLVFALVVVAPIQEELLFRGFLFPGLSQSALRSGGAIIYTAVGWSLLHVQYDLPAVVGVLVLGLALGIARARTGSLYIPIAMHMLNNAVATIVVALAVNH